MTSAIHPKTLCSHFDQHCWSGGPSSSHLKRGVLRSPHSLFETVFPETEAIFYPPRWLCRPLDRARLGCLIALRQNPKRLKIQDA